MKTPRVSGESGPVTQSDETRSSDRTFTVILWLEEKVRQSLLIVADFQFLDPHSLWPGRASRLPIG